MQSDDSLSIPVDLWRPDDSPTEAPRRPALWDGRPFPGKCDIDGCPYQATSAYRHWTGGSPGVGELRQWARCSEHRSAA